MSDILPGRAKQYVQIESAARRVFDLYGFQEIRTPILESITLFKRAIGETTDIVEKEMFTLTDRGDRTLCLRPEGTAGIARAYIENNLGSNQSLVKLFYIGPMFRAERPQKGRFREFEQIGCEAFGNSSPEAEAQMIRMVVQMFGDFGIPFPLLKVNNIGCEICRGPYIEKLRNYLESISNNLSETNQRRLVNNPLRVLDSKEDGEQLTDIPLISDYVCDSCKEHFGKVLNSLSILSVQYRVDPRLVRGLDYYTKSVFEIYPPDRSGSQDALAAGGRYDNLVRDMGGPSVPAVGFALGVERTIAEINNCLDSLKNIDERAGVFVAALGGPAVQKCVKVVEDLRDASIKTESILVNNQSLKSQLRFADFLKVRLCVIVGDNELANNAAIVRDMISSSQTEVLLPNLVSDIKNRLGA